MTRNVSDYIKKLRNRDEELSKGWGQIVTPLSIETAGGKQKVNCAKIIYKKEKGKKVSYKSKRCGYCKKPFLARVDKSKRRKFCSLECIYKSRIGRPRLEKYFTPKELETRRKLSKFGVTFKDE